MVELAKRGMKQKETFPIYIYIIVLFRWKQIECMTENDKIQTTTHDFSRIDKLQSGWMDYSMNIDD